MNFVGALYRIVLAGLFLPAMGCTVVTGLIGSPQDNNNDCQVVTETAPAEWDCSADQISRAQSYSGYGYSDIGSYSDGSVAPSADVTLEATDCEGLAALRRPALKQAQATAIDQTYASILADKCLGKTVVNYYQNGQQVGYCAAPHDNAKSGMYGTGGAAMYSAGGAASNDNTIAIDPTTPGTGATQYSTTNNQVAGVDEADFVKNDGTNVYVLSSGGLHVIQAWPAPDTHEIAYVPLLGEPRRLFLLGDRLVIYTRIGDTTDPTAASSPSSQGCTYGYDCRFFAEGGHTQIIVFDVSQPAKPVQLKRYELSGGFVAARRIGPDVYTVVLDGDMASLPGVDLDLTSTASAADLASEYAAKIRAANDAVDTAPAAEFLPWMRDIDASGNPIGDIEACDNALASRAAQGTSFVSLVSFDLTALSRPTRTLIAGKPGFVYASATSLYLATDGTDGTDAYSSYGSYTSPDNDESTIHKFGLSGLATSYRGSVAVKGHVLNQFSMDELNGVLRLATSNGWVPDPNVTSQLTTVAEQNGGLAQLGQIGGIAPAEDIRSVRFDGTRAFVVTFKKTDPLYVFDLTDPAAPAQLGELKIPGFSTYMHPMDHDHLLAIGFNADDQGSFAWFNGIQLQIFDVTDLANPVLLQKTTIGTRGSASEALTNHLAFNYFPSKGLLAMPMTICEGGGNGVYGDQLTFSGLMVFDVSLTGGIVEHGRMPFVDTAGVTLDPNSTTACSTWWADSTSDVKRSIFMDDYAIGISDSLYQVAALSSLSSVLQKLPLDAQ